MNISINSTLPGTNNVILFVKNNKYFEINIDALTSTEKTVITKFINVVGKHIVINIKNLETPFNEGIAFYIPQDTDLETVSIDYNTLTNTKKANVQGFLTLLLEKTTNNN